MFRFAFKVIYVANPRGRGSPPPLLGSAGARVTIKESRTGREGARNSEVVITSERNAGESLDFDVLVSQVV